MSIGQRVGVEKTGSAFGGTRDRWGYNPAREVVKADTMGAGFDGTYEYDGIGNRRKSADSLNLPGSDNYTSNALNHTPPANTLSPGYDADGNATAYPLPSYPSANSSLVWDAENRLVSATVNGMTTRYLTMPTAGGSPPLAPAHPHDRQHL